MKEPDRCYNQFTGKSKELQMHREQSNFEMSGANGQKSGLSTGGEFVPPLDKIYSHVYE